MQKRKGFLSLKIIGVWEISIFVLAIFAFGFIIGETNEVSAQFEQSLIPSANFNPSQTSSSLPFEGATGAGTSTGAAGTGGSVLDIVNDIFTGKFAGGGLPGHLIAGVAWGVVVGTLAYVIAKTVGLSNSEAQAVGYALGAGTAVGQIAYLQAVTEGGFFYGSGSAGTILGLSPASGAFVLGIGVAVVVFALTYKKESKKVIQLQCLPWEAPLGGADCEKCNQDPLRPCSEYRCKSLGQACELVNKGSEEERCVWVARNDVKSPVITPWVETLTDGHHYTDIQGRPPSRGTKIVRNDASDGCIKPFTPLEFGVKTDEPSQCKIDIVGNNSFEKMKYYFGESNLYRYNHTEQLRLPSADSVNAESPELLNDGIYNFYVRCQDANGNVNEDEFLFNICVDKSPDTTAPTIESTSINTDSPLTFGTQNVDITVNVNEPAECKWSIQDKSYDLMENSMSCSMHVYEQNARQLYPCTTTLTGIKDHQDNPFFFRCKDQPLKAENERNVNTDSYKFNLKGTQPLNILSVGPNSTFTGSSDLVAVNLSVTTDDGANEGKAICSFSGTGEEGSYVQMFETSSFKHEQILTLGSGGYTYYFRCVDDGGNLATATTTFNVFIDREAPKVTRIYKQGVDALQLVTNEDATCTYSINSCNFVASEGIKLTYLNSGDRTTHATQWKPNQALYIKCVDDFGNEPSPNSCSIIASASNVI